MCKLKKIKDALNNSISNVVSSKENFVKNPEKDFVRASKLGFEQIVRILLQAGGQSLCKELSTYFQFDVSMPTPAAFCQQRSKISYEAFQYLFSDFVKSCSAPKTLNGYRILAVDGSEINIPKNESDPETYIYNGEGKQGWNRLHLNALYDLLNHFYVDAIIAPGKETAERASLLQMARNLSDRTHTIVVADRGYESYEMLYNLLEENIPFVLRIKKPDSGNSVISKVDLPAMDEFDTDITLKVAALNSYSRKRSKMQAEKEGYKLINNNKFLFTSSADKKYTFPPFRLVKLQTEGTEPEYLITNLPAETFPAEDIKKIYGMRWGIESAFRELKYDFTLIQFHSKKVDHIKQEMYAKLTMYNFSRMITETLEPQVKEGTKYTRKINFSQAAFYCRYFFLAIIESSQLEGLILRSTSPVRPGRSFKRKTQKKQRKSFQYRVA